MLIHKFTTLFCCFFTIIIMCRFCVAREYCPPSSCGNIPNISFPFRLTNDPRNCGHPYYELTCENNTTLAQYIDHHSSSYKYIVRAINYLNNTISLAYPNLSQNNTCSLPNQILHFDIKPHNILLDDNFMPKVSDFRLTNDPRNCGHSDYELTCENNTTLALYIDHRSSSYKFIVRAIDYANYTISLSYPSLSQNNTCSLPNHSTTEALFRPSPFTSYIYQRITFMSCPYTVNHSWLLLEVDDSCGLHTNMTTDTTRSSYIMLGRLYPSDIMEMCTVYLQLLWSPPIPSLLDSNNKSSVSLSEIHASLLNGFQLSWDYYGYSCVGMCVYSCNFFVIWSKPCGGLPIWFLRALYSPMPKLYIITQGNVRSEVQDKTTDFKVIAVVLLVLVTMCHLAIRIILGITACIWLLIYTLRKRQRSTFDTIEGFLRSNNDLMPIRYSYKEIKKMTKGFREKLGQGGYGSVYKGKLRSGRIVAVKLLTKPKENGQDFINEIATIGRIHHVNVVKLVGFYAGIFSNKRALVFDFMPNGSLEKYILNRQSPDPLSWERKYEIAVGVARGIEYLHTGCDIQILHFDIKPHNILLDDNFMPKVSDFGLAKLYAIEKNTMTLTAARGTIGYVAPELINRSIGRVSYKADVYSFGMLLMEMVGQNRDIKANEGESSQYFPDWIYNRINKGKDIETGDADHIEGEEDDIDDGNEKRIKRKMTVVGLWCIQMSPVDRPSMSEVVKMLESPNGDIQIPPRPSLPTQIGRYSEQSNWVTESSGSIALLDHDACSGDHNISKCIEMTT